MPLLQYHLLWPPACITSHAPPSSWESGFCMKHTKNMQQERGRHALHLPQLLTAWFLPSQYLWCWHHCDVPGSSFSDITQVKALSSHSNMSTSRYVHANPLPHWTALHCPAQTFGCVLPHPALHRLHPTVISSPVYFSLYCKDWFQPLNHGLLSCRWFTGTRLSLLTVFRANPSQCNWNTRQTVSSLCLSTNTPGGFYMSISLLCSQWLWEPHAHTQTSTCANVA